MSSSKPHFTKFEWLLLIVFIVLDVGLFFVGKTYLRSRNPTEVKMKAALPAQEDQAIQKLEMLAKSGSWDALENARAQQAEAFLRAKTRPSTGVALYFYPETLREHSFEKEFAISELKSGLETLRQAYEARSESAAANAYEKLETRVENFELGMEQESEDLSGEAKRFLRTYKNFVTFK